MEVLSACMTEAQEDTGMVARFVDGWIFESICTIVIIFNALHIGYAAEYAITHVEEPTNVWVTAGAWFFTVYYILEISLRLIVHRQYFFFVVEWRWNVLDFCLVLGAIYNQVVVFASGDGSGGSSNMLRMLRLLKMVKMLRVVRVMRSFKELRMMLMPIVNSMRSLFWTLCMLTIILYIFGIVFLQGAAALLVDSQSQHVEGFDSFEEEALLEHWGSVGSCMFTLYAAITGGNDWVALAAPLQFAGFHYYAFFVFYTSFLSFAVLNILTGIFVESAMSYSISADDEVAINEYTDPEYVRQLLELITTMDTDESGALSYQEFEKNSGTKILQEWLSRQSISLPEAKSLFWRLTGDGSYEVSINDFVHFVSKMKGNARSSDLQALAYDTKRLSLSMESFCLANNEHFGALEARLSALSSLPVVAGVSPAPLLYTPTLII